MRGNYADPLLSLKIFSTKKGGLPAVRFIPTVAEIQNSNMIRTYLSELIKEMRLAAADLTKAADGLEKLVHFAGNGASNSVPPKSSRAKNRGIQTLEELERRAIRQALEQTDGNQSEAARLLGVGRDQFRYRMAKHRLGNDIVEVKNRKNLPRR